MFLQQPGEVLSLRNREFEHHFHAAVFADTDVGRIFDREEVPQILAFVQDGFAVAALLLPLLLLKLSGSLPLAHGWTASCRGVRKRSQPLRFKS